jgi:hypothetical protein
MRPNFLASVLLFAFIFSYPSYVCPGNFELAEETGAGIINWTHRTLEAKGRGVSGPEAANTPEGWQAAVRNARRQAYVNLLETFRQLRLSGHQLVGQLFCDDDKTLAKIEQLLKSAQICDTVYHSDGTVEVVRKISFSGALSQLILPASIVQLEMKNLGRTKTDPGDRPFTGLVVDASSTGVVPAMCFEIVDESGRSVYGSAYVSREFVVQNGMCGYVNDFSAVEPMGRAGNNPLVVRALGTSKGSLTDIVISNTDASRLRSRADNLFFLRECRVIVVCDPFK